MPGGEPAADAGPSGNQDALCGDLSAGAHSNLYCCNLVMGDSALCNSLYPNSCVWSRREYLQNGPPFILWSYTSELTNNCDADSHCPTIQSDGEDSGGPGTVSIETADCVTPDPIPSSLEPGTCLVEVIYGSFTTHDWPRGSTTQDGEQRNIIDDNCQSGTYCPAQFSTPGELSSETYRTTELLVCEGTLEESPADDSDDTTSVSDPEPEPEAEPEPESVYELDAGVE